MMYDTPVHYHLTALPAIVRHVKLPAMTCVPVPITENPDGSYRIPADNGRGTCTPTIVAIPRPACNHPGSRRCKR